MQKLATNQSKTSLEKLDLVHRMRVAQHQTKRAACGLKFDLIRESSLATAISSCECNAVVVPTMKH